MSIANFIRKCRRFRAGRRNARRYGHIRARRHAMGVDVSGYQNRITLLSRGEAAFFGPLQQAVAGRFLIMCKVRLADIVTCSDAAWRRGMGPAIAQKHLDFVLCDFHTTRFLMAIELDDRSHDRADRQRRDCFVNQVLAQAGVRLMRFRASARYSVESIRQRILTRLDEQGRPELNRNQDRLPDSQSAV